MKLLGPILASLLFIVLGVYFTNYFSATLALLHLNGNSGLALFISSPFNMSTEGNLPINLFCPAILIFIFGVYLKNFNKSFQRRCGLQVVFIIGVLASYATSILSMLYYPGYAGYGISLGTSVITISFITAFILSLTIYVERKEHFSHLYGHSMFMLILGLILVLALLTAITFLSTSSYLVHLTGFIAFIVLFVPFYERHNIARAIQPDRLQHAGNAVRVTFLPNRNAFVYSLFVYNKIVQTMNLKCLLLLILVLALPCCVNAQSAAPLLPTPPSSNASYISTYGTIDIVGVMVLILIVVFAYALQKRRSKLLKIKNATQKQKINMLNKEYAIIMKEGAKLQQEGAMLKQEYAIMMKEGARLQQEQEKLKKKARKAGSR